MTLAQLSVIALWATTFAPDRHPRSIPLKEGDVVQLSGTLSSEPFFGPPNYGEDPATDERDTAYILKLDRPMIFLKSDQTPVTVGEVQIADPSACSSFPRGIYRGAVHEKISGHHRRDVILGPNNGGGALGSDDGRIRPTPRLLPWRVRRLAEHRLRPPAVYRRPCRPRTAIRSATRRIRCWPPWPLYLATSWARRTSTTWIGASPSPSTTVAAQLNCGTWRWSPNRLNRLVARVAADEG